MDRLQGPRLKVRRAKRHIEDLAPLVQGFLAKEPYEIVEYQDPETGKNRARVKIHADPDPLWALIIGDVIHNLRSALDLLYCQLVAAHRSGPITFGDFRIYDAKTNFDGGTREITKRVGKEAFEILRDDIKPYRGGNDALWCLHYLDLIDKHRLLLVVGHSNPVIYAVVSDEHGNEIASHPYPTTSSWPLKDGDEIPAGTPIGLLDTDGNPLPESKMKMELKAAFAVTLYEPTVIGIPEPLGLSLANMTSAVERTVEAFKTILT